VTFLILVKLTSQLLSQSSVTEIRGLRNSLNVCPTQAFGGKLERQILQRWDTSKKCMFEILAQRPFGVGVMFFMGLSMVK
jgi:hypothetical protein